MKQTEVEECISDESDFYGEEALVKELEDRADSYNVLPYWTFHARVPAALATTAKPTWKKDLHNPYEGHVEIARQLAETATDFANRLAPSRVHKSDVGEWLLIANPHVQHSFLNIDYEGLRQHGGAVLERYLEFKSEVEAKMKQKPPSALQKRLRPAQDALARDIKNLAVKCNLLTGKWMLFCNIEHLDQTWEKVCEGVVNNALGISAKVATTGVGKSDENVRLICVYTKDFTDEADVRRVILSLASQGLAGMSHERPAWYKIDAYTHLGIEGKNEYGLRNSLFGSMDFLEPG